jgi:DNA-binding GntR family transcriptional regulator
LAAALPSELGADLVQTLASGAHRMRESPKTFSADVREGRACSHIRATRYPIYCVTRNDTLVTRKRTILPLPDSIGAIARPTARTLVFERLKSLIEQGALLPGEIIRDSEIAERLGVSRTPVREALQRLEHQGVVETAPGKSTRVVRVSLPEALLVYAPLAVLQGLAAKLATPLVTRADLKEMSAKNEALLEAVNRNDSAAAREIDTALHDVLIRRAANPFLRAAIEPLLLQVTWFETLFFALDGTARQAHQEHEAIIAAVAAGDASAASSLTLHNWRPPIRSPERT